MKKAWCFAGVLLLGACGQGGDAGLSEDGAPVLSGEAVPASLRQEIERDATYEATQRLLVSQGRGLDWSAGRVRYLDPARTTFEVRVPLRAAGQASDGKSLVFARQIDGRSSVSVASQQDGDARAANSGSCGPFMRSDTCKFNGTWTGSRCVDYSQLFSYPRNERRFYLYGQQIIALDTQFSCGPLDADSGCYSTCN